MAGRGRLEKKADKNDPTVRSRRDAAIPGYVVTRSGKLRKKGSMGTLVPALGGMSKYIGITEGKVSRRKKRKPSRKKP